MHLGLGLYRSTLTSDNLRFARQAGATHIVAHLVDYFASGSPTLATGSNEMGWGASLRGGQPWTFDEIAGLKAAVNAEGLTLEAIENFDPAHWHDILLDGPQKRAQMEALKQMVRDVGRAGIPIIGYNFSIAGVWGWRKEPVGRGGAMSLVYDESRLDKHVPIPNGMVWNMRYDSGAGPGWVAPVSSAELWERFAWFLREILPVAEDAGVRLALHPDDPPTDALRGAARLVNAPAQYDRMLEVVPSSASALELCLGSLQEMPGADVVRHAARWARDGRVAYVHARNVRGAVPHYTEVFIDEGDLDMLGALRALHEAGFRGVVIPDHTPDMTCGAPWHAGMAHALGYLRACLQVIASEASARGSVE